MTIWQEVLGESEEAGRSALRAAALPGREEGARWALTLGRPLLALEFSADPWIRVPALLRLGRSQEALAQSLQLPANARREVLRARALSQQGDREVALAGARAARQQARREGDAPALIAAATLLGELEGDAPFQALRSLAEGLKVAEIVGEEADAHLLAVLAQVQLRTGGGRGGAGKARATAAKALERAAPRSPAQVIALLALGEETRALVTAAEGALHPCWWRAFGERPST